MNLSHTIIRLLKKEDLPALEWDGEFKHFRRLYSEIFKSAGAGKALMWIADLPGDSVIGQLFIQLTSSRIELADGCVRAYIYGFRIKPAYRRLGLGKRMLLVVEDDLMQRGFQIATLNVAQDNPDARRLYEQMGYQVIGTDPGQWSYLDHLGNRRDVREPAWRMEKALQSVAVSLNN